MPFAYRRRALALFGLISAVPALSFASAGWKTVTLPFGKGLKMELPAAAKPELLGNDWFSNSFASGAKLPDGAGFASAFTHEFRENPLALESYAAGVRLEQKIRDLTVAKCYAENADIHSYCPPDEVKVSAQESKWGKIFVVSGVMRFRRGGAGEVRNEAMMVVLPTGENEAIVFRSLAGEIKRRFLGSLGIKVTDESAIMKTAPVGAAIPLAPKAAPALAAPSAPTGAVTDPKMAPQVPPAKR